MISTALDKLPTSILDTIGNTPLMRMKRLFLPHDHAIYGKLEAFNPGGSIKDRTAMQLISHAIHSGELKSGDTVVESSSGNMGIGLAQICNYFNLKLEIVVDPMVNNQTVQIMKAYGANINRVDKPANPGGFLQARLDKVQEIMRHEKNCFWTNQYANRQNPEAHLTTMKEIEMALGEAPDFLFAATSTCGTLMGCIQYIQEKELPTQVVAVDAMGSVIFGSAPGERKIPGHGASRKSQFLNPELIADVVHVDDRDCVRGCRKLLDRESLLCGGSSGAVVAALENYLPLIPNDSTIAMILCDRGERYLDTIYNDEWVERELYQEKALAL